MPFILEESTIADINSALMSGEITSKELVMMYLERIADLDKGEKRLNSILEINPDALFVAEAMDIERATNGRRGPLHGIPVLIKDNINTFDKMHTSAGSLALSNLFAPYDAFLVQKLREAGAVILGKTNMTEFANYMTEDMPNGYSSRGGQVNNSYIPGGDTGGSSSGSGVAVSANLCTVAVGTETSGSILSPCNQNSIVGIKPTVGLISRAGIIPISISQDTAGPMARTVRDAALLLGVLTGMDPNDPATWTSAGKSLMDYTPFLNSAGLHGARIGVPRKDYFDGVSDDMLKVIDILKDLGAEIVDNTDIPAYHEFENSDVLRYEFKTSINSYLATLGDDTKVHNLKEIIDFNTKHSEETLKYGQSLLLSSEDTSGTLTEPRYIKQRLKDIRLSQEEGIDFALDEYDLDALLFFGTNGCDIAARAGYPSVIVPAGYKEDGTPFGITFTGSAYSESVLIKFAYAFEQATKARKAPILE